MRRAPYGRSVGTTPEEPPRYPRYGRFLATGAGAGLLVAAAVALAAPRTEAFGRGQLLLYLMLVFGLVGALLGAAVAVLLEARRQRPGAAGAPGDEGERSPPAGSDG